MDQFSFSQLDFALLGLRDKNNIVKLKEQKVFLGTNGMEK